MFTLEIIVPKQHVPEKFDKYISSSRIKVQETGELVKLTKSSIPKIIGLKLVTVNNAVLKDKSTKVKPNDHIIIKLSNIDQYKVQSKGDNEQKESNNINKQPAWWDKNQQQQQQQQQQKPNINNNNKKPQLNNNNSNSSSKINLVSTNIKLEVLYEDENLAVINKPAGMLVHPSNTTHTVVLNKEDQTHTLVNALIHRYGVSNLSNIGGSERPGIVHRLDKDTAGIIIIARNNDTHQKLQTLFEEHTSTMIKNTTEQDEEPENQDFGDDDQDDEGEYYNDEDGDDEDDDSDDDLPKLQTQVPSRPATITTNHLSKLMQGKNIPLTVQKKYHCIVLGKPKETHGFINKKIARHPGDKNKMVIDEQIGKEALTEYKLLKVWDNVDVQVYDEKKNKLISKSLVNNNTSNNNNTNSTLSEYDSVLNQLSKNKKNKNKKSNQSNKPNQLNSRMSVLSVDSDEDDEDDEDNEDEEDSDEDAVYLDSEDEDEDEDSDEDAVYLDSDESNEDDEDEEISTKKENYDEILNRLQRTKSIGSNTFSLLEVTLHTGRSHQIRVHMASENLPIVGDPIYSSKSKQFLVSHLLLASVNLKFIHPITNEIKEFTIDHPSHFKQFINSIENNNKNSSNNNQSSTSKSTSSKKSNTDLEENETTTKSVKNNKNKTPQNKLNSTTSTHNNYTITESSKNNANKNINNNNNNNKNNKKKNNNYINSMSSLDEKLEKDLLSSFLN